MASKQEWVRTTFPTSSSTSALFSLMWLCFRIESQQQHYTRYSKMGMRSPWRLQHYVYTCAVCQTCLNLPIAYFSSPILHFHYGEFTRNQVHLSGCFNLILPFALLQKNLRNVSRNLISRGKKPDIRFKSVIAETAIWTWYQVLFIRFLAELNCKVSNLISGCIYNLISGWTGTTMLGNQVQCYKISGPLEQDIRFVRTRYQVPCNLKSGSSEQEIRFLATWNQVHQNKKSGTLQHEIRFLETSCQVACNNITKCCHQLSGSCISVGANIRLHQVSRSR